MSHTTGTPPRQQQVTASPCRLWHLADRALIATGVLITLVAVYAYGVEPGLSVVDPRAMQVAPRFDEVPGDWRGAAVVGVFAMIASAGLPRPAASKVATRSAAGQVAAAVAAALGAVAALMLTSVWTFGPEDPCRYSSCWPASAQAVAIAAPALVAALSLVVSALAVTRTRRAVRVLVPALTWLGLILLLQVVWEPWLLPAFLSSPP